MYNLIAKNGLLRGSSLTFGTIVGAGMFSLPIASVDVWSIGALILITFTWLMMLLSGLMLLETSVHFPTGASFHTLVKKTLGHRWNFINNTAMLFCGYILIYAYISAGGSLVSQMLILFDISVPGPLCCIIFTGCLSFLIWHSIDAVGHCSFILISVMCITFLIFASSFVKTVSIENIFLTTEPEKSLLPEGKILLPSISFFLCSFGFHQIIPSLGIKFKSNTHDIFYSLIIGTLGALILYGLWLIIVFGNLPFHELKSLSQQSNNVDALLARLYMTGINPFISGALVVFSGAAMISSFLGVGAGMFDFLADLRGIGDYAKARLTTIGVTMLPPSLCCLFAPHGFVTAIGYAGLCATLWAIITPALCMRVCRQRFTYTTSHYQLKWGNIWFYAVMLFGLVNLGYFIYVAWV